MNVVSRKAIIFFLLSTFVLSGIFYFLVIHTGRLGSGFNLYVTGLMWCPGISALLTLKLFKGDFSYIGWRWPQWKYIQWSYLLPVLYATIAYLLIWIVGWGRFYDEIYVKNIAKSFGFDSLPAWMTILLFLIFMGIYGMVRSSAAALGEEIGWRGFLVPALYQRVGFTKTSLITGLIWSVWHYPILLFADYNSGTPAWYALSCFTVMVISISFAYTWFRLKSGSVWPNVILHATHNLYIQLFFTPVTADTGNTKYYVDEFGAVLPLVCVVIAVYYWRRRSELK